MAQTAKYCTPCARKFSPADTSPEAKDFLNASLFVAGMHPIGKKLRSEAGVCEKCKQLQVVTYYEDRGLPTVLLNS